MVQALSKELTLEAFLAEPETKPASEYIDGKIIQKSMPQGEHSTIQGELIMAINAITKPQKIARSFPELRCVFANRAIVPDVSVFSWNRIPRNEDGSIANLFAIAPDWMIEILSPEQRSTKVIAKILHSLKHGTQLGWLIDPKEKAILIFYPNQSLDWLDQPEKLLPVPDFANNLQLTVGDIFNWLLE
jgi:Uma2 family endonuclease